MNCSKIFKVHFLSHLFSRRDFSVSKIQFKFSEITSKDKKKIYNLLAATVKKMLIREENKMDLFLCGRNSG